tara:strand:- start:8 stop:385 length:378 start_codon:yes stop_codon:yes gene_type:complete
MISLNPSSWFPLKAKKEEDSTDWLNRVINELAHPHDSMPIANGDNKYASPERRAELDLEMIALEENPRPEEEVANWFIDEEDGQEYEGPVEETIHEKMYKIATSKYNPFAVGGSEKIQDFDERLS